ncbi:GIY-YIG nuclease family protein [Beijerinckia sp. L45]|uniref:GIY-YIG nuclease family protein n=1 Tax=Beijerinckia sp. L45 TaxID=1641855 RepID=UPI00131BE235|nr:GIY-YIG nuclease family protein [Beijerinckia sp. L45]
MRDQVRAATRSIYLIKPVGMDGPIKIGCSHLPPKRLSELMHWSPVALEIVASFAGSTALEANLHSCLARSHSHKEWFFATNEVRQFIANILAGEPAEVAIDLGDKKGAPQRRSQWTPARRVKVSLCRRYHAALRRGEMISDEVRAIKRTWDKRDLTCAEINLLEHRFPLRGTNGVCRQASAPQTGAEA